MEKVSTGIPSLDAIIDSIYVGDNVVWEVEAGTLYHVFIKNFIRQSFAELHHVVYISFNRSPQSVLQKIADVIDWQRFTFVDCFTAGKGKNDLTFKKFYDKIPRDLNMIRVERPKNVDEVTQIINDLEDKLPPGARSIFDSLTGMQDLWISEDETYRFFTYMCPRLYDLGTVAYWILEKEAHSPKFKANLRHITQVVLDLYKRRDKLFIKALKLDSRQEREAFKPHMYEVSGESVSVTATKKEAVHDIGSRVREARLRRNMSQKELADKVGLTPSFISQLENNQISPSLNSFLHLCTSLGVSPGLFLDGGQQDIRRWFISRHDAAARGTSIAEGVVSCLILDDIRYAVNMITFLPNAALNRHVTAHGKPELYHIAEGVVTVVVSNREQKLVAGDSVYFTDQAPSAWRNEGGETARLLVVA
ncbi:MAG: helix-turn-helix domain protein [Nitrospirae bacterium]|nr:MAG: helix-turn-helix domain protein [Nitrospirota bacterium]